MADERNFRSHYYDKVGFRAVEEKKSVEILLKEQTIDNSKLFQFVLRFPLISAYRLTVWKYLLGVVPVYQEIHEFVMEQRREQFHDLKHALIVMEKIDEKTQPSAVFLQMYLINEGCLPYDEICMLQEPRNQAFMAITDSVSEISSSEVETFWLAVKFFQYLDKFKSFMQILPQRTEDYLKKEDKDGTLFNHLQKLHVFEVIPLQHWFECCFARVLPEDTFERIWDRVLGGSCKVMVFVAVAMLLTYKWTILNMNSAEKIIQMLETDISVDSGEMIVNHALELWQKYGHQLLPSLSHADSPVPDARPSA
ncbi:TBC1 domain family member 7-like [Lineus longissimus]|uniref:TBC1 domain family member 7-like n=1 Tax=Lineus longissimus TaxID=88925 RepID=UPI002B4EA7EC